MQRLKTLFFIFLFALLWLPFIQQLTKYFKETELKGAFVKPTLPKFSIDSLNEFKFQQQYENYENSNFGFRGIFIKIKNSLNYLVFKELSIEDNIAGKDNYIFSVGSIRRTLGLDYNGKNKNAATIEKINFLKKGVEKHGGHLLVLIAPSKESIYPDYLPNQYKQNTLPQNDYADFIEGYKKYNIPYIDYCVYFKNLKDNAQYSLFTKTGFHWSLYGASIAHDTLIHYIANTIGKEIPAYRKESVELSDTAREPDNDFEGPLNLLFTLSQHQYAYFKQQIITETKNKYRPKVIVIGDSFFWQLKNQKMMSDIFSFDSKFWFYFATTSFPIGDEPGVPLNTINIMKEIEEADFVLLVGNISTLNTFPYGIEEYYANHVSNNDILENIIESINHNPKWLEEVLNKTKDTANIAMLEAKNIFSKRKIVHLKASNNKYLYVDGNNKEIAFANSDNGWDWETFSILSLGNNKVAIYSHKGKFLSVELESKSEITATKNKVGDLETFTLIKLKNDYMALKATNGKYLSLDENTKQIFAKGDSIGVNEKFKLEILNKDAI